MADKRKSSAAKKKVTGGKQKNKGKEAEAPAPALDEDVQSDFGGMNVSNFKKNLGCGG